MLSKLDCLCLIMYRSRIVCMKVLISFSKSFLFRRCGVGMNFKRLFRARISLSVYLRGERGFYFSCHFLLIVPFFGLFDFSVFAV